MARQVGEPDAGRSGGGKEVLKMGEKPSAAGDCKEHAAQLPQQLVQVGNSDAVAVQVRINDVQETGLPMWRQCNGALQSVHIPAQNGFVGRPTGVALLELLGGDGLPAEGSFGWEVGSKHLIVDVHEPAAVAVELRSAALGHEDFVIHKDIGMEAGCCRTPAMALGPGRQGGQVNTVFNLCSAIDVEWLEELFPDLFSDVDETVFDEKQKRVVSRRIVRFQRV